MVHKRRVLTDAEKKRAKARRAYLARLSPAEREEAILHRRRIQKQRRAKHRADLTPSAKRRHRQATRAKFLGSMEPNTLAVYLAAEKFKRNEAAKRRRAALPKTSKSELGRRRVHRQAQHRAHKIRTQAKIRRHRAADVHNVAARPRRATVQKITRWATPDYRFTAMAVDWMQTMLFDAINGIFANAVSAYRHSHRKTSKSKRLMVKDVLKGLAAKSQYSELGSAAHNLTRGGRDFEVYVSEHRTKASPAYGRGHARRAERRGPLLPVEHRTAPPRRRARRH